jgi:hypothetical protein
VKCQRPGFKLHRLRGLGRTPKVSEMKWPRKARRRLANWLAASARRLNDSRPIVPRSGRILPEDLGSGLRLDSYAATLARAAVVRGNTTEQLASRALAEGRYRHPHFVAHIEHLPPSADVVFVSVCNDKYAPGLEALVLSLRKQYPGLTNRYVVYHDGTLSEFNQQRLTRIYPQFEFAERATDRFKVVLGSFRNHRRVGLLGYLSLEAIEIEDASHVVILDVDLFVVGDISPLWQGDKIKAVPDIGARPFCVVSGLTGRPIINSGVLSLPRSARGPDATERRDAILAELAQHADPDILRFADQRFWNIFFGEREIELLPQNFNCVKSLLTGAFKDRTGLVSIIHLTGSKPWYEFINESLLTPGEKDEENVTDAERGIFLLWHQDYRRNLLASRLAAYREDCTADHAGLAGRCAEKKPVALIGNGPSISRTDLDAFDGFEKFVFNWFVNHEDWDKVAPDHLVIASHMIFGGWHTPRPKLPPEYLDALLAHSHRPRLWFPYYFKAYVDGIPELQPYEISYFFFEKPFKQRVGRTGRVELSLSEPLVDCNTGVITAGMPIAVLLGARDIVLVGCDSNYASTQGTYFYAADRHASATTRKESLLATWSADGEGFYAYAVAQKALEQRGIRLADATLDGNLTMLPKLSLAEVRAMTAR